MRGCSMRVSFAPRFRTGCRDEIGDSTAMSARRNSRERCDALNLFAQHGTRRGDAVVTIVEDFAPVLEAVAALERSTLEGTSDTLSAKAFRRASILPALARRLGLSPGRWCCLDDRAIPVPAATETASVGM